MKKVISYLLVISLLLSIFSDMGNSIAYAKLEANETAVTVEESVYVPGTNPLVDGELTVDESVYEKKWGVFSEEQVEIITQQYTLDMKKLAVYFYTELTPLLETEQLFEVLDLTAEELPVLINKLTEAQQVLLRELTPLTMQQYDYDHNYEEVLAQQNVEVEVPFIEANGNPKLEAIVDQYESVTASTYSSQAKKSGRVSTSSTGNSFRFTEKNSEFQYKANTDSNVDPIYKTANQKDVDLYLPGRNGLDFSLVRSYSSLNAKIMQPSLDGDLSNPVCHPDNAAFQTGLPDCMGNFPYPSYYDYGYGDDLGFIATGWSLNIPKMTEGTISATIASTLTSTNINFYNRATYSTTDTITFDLDDGSSYEFRGNDKTPYNHPYNNVTYFYNGTGYSLVLDDKITYTFNRDGQILSKSNRLGDQITYDYQQHANRIIITDSIGRKIQTDGPLGAPPYGIQGFTVTDPQGNLTHKIKYNMETDNPVMQVRTYVFGTTEEYRNDENPRSVFFSKLTSVVDVLANKTLKTYTYQTPSLTTRADFNFEDDYMYYMENGKPVLDFLNGAESNEIIQRDNKVHGEINYLLLDKVTDYSGLETNFKYRPYKWDWFLEVNGYKREQDRGTMRLYLDPWNLTYIGYHPVTNVYYSYTNKAGEKKFLTQDVAIFSSYAQEIWTTPKTGGIVENFRLKNSNEFRRPEFAVTISLDLGEYREGSTTVYRPSGKGSFVPVNESKGQLGFYNFLKFKEEGNDYGISFQENQAYQYDPGKNKPYLTKVFGNDNKSDIHKFLSSGNDRTLPANLDKYASLYRTEYDAFGYVIYQEDPYGNKMEMAYGGPYHQISSQKQTAADGLTKSEITYTYNADGTPLRTTQLGSYRDPATPSVVRQDQTVTDYLNYNSSKQPTRIRTTSSGSQYDQQPTEAIVDMQYDASNLHVIKETTNVTLGKGKTPTPLVVLYEYDNKDQLKKQTFPDGSTVTYSYDPSGRMASESYTPSAANPGAVRTTNYTYDDAQRLVLQTKPDGEKVNTYYTPYGDIEKQEQIVGNASRVLVLNKTNLTGKLLKSTLPYGSVDKEVKYAYGQNGLISRVTDPIGQATDYYYSNVMTKEDGSAYYLQNTTKVVGRDGKETWNYQDRLGRVIKQVEKAGAKTRTVLNTYTPLGALSQTRVIADGVTQTTQYGYDTAGNLIYLKDNNNQVNRYVYNSRGQLIATYTNDKLQKQSEYNEVGWQLTKTNAEGKKESFQYTNTGLLDTRTDEMMQKHQYSYTPYDEVSRLSVKDTAGIETYWEQYSYDAITRLLTSTTTIEGETLDYQYDSRKRLSSQTVAGRKYELEYDAFDRMTALNYPDNQKVSYTYDVLDRLLTVTTPNMGTVGYNYTVGQNEHTNILTYPNGVTQQRKTNAFGELKSYNQTSTGNVSNWNETFVYDGFSNIININRNGSTQAFSYDALNRIKEENTAEGQRAYTYDDRGNRSTVSGSSPDMLEETTSYTYNSLNKLKTYSSSDGTKAVYSYYGDGLRATKNVNGKITRYVYLNGHIIEEIDDKGNVEARNIWGSKLIFRQDYVANKKGYYSYNGHGDVVKITDGSGQTINTYDYDIWGNLLSKTENMTNPFKYSGEYYDDESSLYYLRARYYDPSIGRFISKDSYEGDIKNPLSLNRYSYVENNPLIYTDSSGNVKIKSPVDTYLEGLRIGQYGSYEGRYYHQYFDDHDITREEFLKGIGIKQSSYDSPSIIGKLTSANKKQEKKLEDDEKFVVDRLRLMGNNVYLNPTLSTPTYDFLLNGKLKVELKTSNSPDGKMKVSSAIGPIVYGIVSQGADMVIYDLSANNISYTTNDIYLLDFRLREYFQKNNLSYSYTVQVWTSDGIYSFDNLAPDAMYA
ncbi:RHS repeat-associated core domain-containing protein [Paenibacillus algorifonticola]|uniref:RHS repeat-associated core domain-containing protein n=1 Tax=Paenibacillus algorifonticola TaxID=684063 RepID=A0A1I2IX58_9BACL|nr:RHS repeat-associated core domain-containing protein [Paenibacillus algorifonticola]SFF46779.1 RHS repeat-associated core domain-containing protein [Paenibacillus algorifonticola]